MWQKNNNKKKYQESKCLARSISEEEKSEEKNVCWCVWAFYSTLLCCLCFFFSLLFPFFIPFAFWFMDLYVCWCERCCLQCETLNMCGLCYLCFSLSPYLISSQCKEGKKKTTWEKWEEKNKRRSSLQQHQH